MAYTNATFYLDLVNGSDAARAGKTPTAYANNGSGAVRVTIATHGYVTGTIVDITGTTSGVYNGAWKITVIDANNFDLQASTYSVNPATKGSVTSRGGSSWSDAWLTTTNGATAARISAGDTIRYAKSGDPVSIGNATWTNKSTTVTLASAQTTTIDNCETAWTAANGSTVIRNSSGPKEGTYSAQITLPAAPAINTKYAYFTLPATLNLSAYQQITFWYYFNGTMVDANRAAIKLCSDTTGDTAVDTFAFPANTGATNVWIPLTITKTGGGNLGSSINSIAFYSGSSAPPASQPFVVDNFSACTTNGLNLSSLISKNSAAYGGTDTWHGLQSINGTTVILANQNSVASGGLGLKGYYTTGTSPETVTTYIRPTVKLPTLASNAISNSITTSGTATNLITYSGGWNTSTNTQDGETWLDGQNGASICFQGFAINYWKIERLNPVRFNNGFNNGSSTSSIGCDINAICINCTTGMSGYFSNSTITYRANNCNIPYTSQATSPETFNNYMPTLIVKNNGSNLLLSGSNLMVDNLEMYNSSGTLQVAPYLSEIYITNLISDSNGTGLYNSQAGAFPAKTYIKNATVTNNTNATTANCCNLIINKLTASGNTNKGGALSLIVKQLNASTSQIFGSDVTGVTGARESQPSVFYSAINNVQTDNRGYWAYGNALSQTTTRHTASGIAWQINITSTNQTSTLPCFYPIAQVACNAGTSVTVKAWVLKSHATDIAAQLLVKAYEIAGVTADVTAAKSNDTNWEELTISFTPTINGVAQIYLSAWWVANAASQSVYVDDITVTQA